MSNASEDDEIEDDTSVSAYEILEIEAAKAVADSFRDSFVPDIAKITVLILILKSFPENSCSQIDRDYSLLLPVVKSGLALAFDLEAKTVDSNGEDNGVNIYFILLKDFWTCMIATVSLLVTPLDNTLYTFYTPHTDKILELMSYTLKFSPKRTFASIATTLFQGSKDSIECARLHCTALNGVSTNSSHDAAKYCRDALQIFKACFKGLCKCEGQGNYLREITKKTLEDVIESVGKINRTEEYSELITSPNRLEGIECDSVKGVSVIDVQVETALIVCDSISDGAPELKELIIAVFSWLCQLTNVKNGLLRQKAGEVLGCIDLAAVIAENIEEKVNAEKRAEMANERVLELEDELEVMRDELDNMQKEMTGLNITEFLN